MAKKKRFNYIRKKLAPGTWYDIATVLISFILLMSCIAASAVMKGQGPMVLGAIGVSSIVAAIYTIFNVVSVEKNPDYNYLPTSMAGIIAGIIIIIWILLLVIGLFY